MERQKCKLKKMRESRGMRQVELAGRSRVSISYLQVLETGWLRPSESIQAKLADALGCNVDEIFPGKQEA